MLKTPVLKNSVAMSFHLVSTKSAKIHFYYTFCFIITVVYFSNIVYNISNAEEDLDDEGKYLFCFEKQFEKRRNCVFAFVYSNYYLSRFVKYYEIFICESNYF